MTTTSQMKRRAILMSMLNRSGVLNKVSMLIRRKMYNVETLTVCKTNQPGISRMTLTLREDSDAKTLQVIKQLEKMSEVISARELDVNHSFWREVAIIRFEADSQLVERMTRQYQFEILDQQSYEVYVAQVAGTSQLIDRFMAEIGKDKIIEVARSGFTAMEK
jgi:acetolactate synthase-1/3 small subunit